ncbi:PaaI family thioesterase [Metapseudomonas lalkuanensis]|uniref:PaaI family thioesterase n=1 Tax=Metapseudomonas lalkuanensis TaxID=2604832 RepID=A0A5J6QRG6_9GAMM|nr:PaaI family thioesterase [Pseudomonas lalkuanensis]QEY63276.1 PaaI family thioesterase [Pseudomonas lalkuanensis]
MQLSNPFLQSLGVELVHWVSGEAEFRMPIEARHLNRQGMLHGGLVATLLDAACGYAGLHAAEGEAEVHGVTVMLNVAYLQAVRSGTVLARGRVSRNGRSLYFAEASLLAEDGRLLATAQGTFRQGGGRHVA